MPKLNFKINTLHKFLEISFINFYMTDESIIKQVSIMKKSGKKTMKTLIQEIMTCFE